MKTSKIDQWIIDRFKPLTRWWMPHWRVLTRRWPVDVRIHPMVIHVIQFTMGVIFGAQQLGHWDELGVIARMGSIFVVVVFSALLSIILIFHPWQWIAHTVVEGIERLSGDEIKDLENIIPKWRWYIDDNWHNRTKTATFLLRKDAVYVKLMLVNKPRPVT